MKYCCYCTEEKVGITHLKGFKNDIGICLDCRSILDKISKKGFSTIVYFEFVDRIRQNYESLKKIKK